MSNSSQPMITQIRDRFVKTIRDSVRNLSQVFASDPGRYIVNLAQTPNSSWVWVVALNDRVQRSESHGNAEVNDLTIVTQIGAVNPKEADLPAVMHNLARQVINAIQNDDFLSMPDVFECFLLETTYDFLEYEGGLWVGAADVQWIVKYQNTYSER